MQQKDRWNREKFSTDTATSRRESCQCLEFIALSEQTVTNINLNDFLKGV